MQTNVPQDPSMTAAPNVPATFGAWISDDSEPAFEPAAIAAAIQRTDEPLHVVRDPATGRLGVALGGQRTESAARNGHTPWPVVSIAPATYPEWLGDRTFCEVHGLRFPYVAGAMANGIATTELVIAMANAGMLGFFGAAGLSLANVSDALDRLDAALGQHGPAWGSNLIHSPNEPATEAGCVELYLRRGVRRVSASAYMALNATVVRYAVTGLRRLPGGRIARKNHLFAKISRPEVARHFMSPAPQALLDTLLADGAITADEARLAKEVAVAEDIIVEADSGGHTDNQPAAALFPIIAALRDELTEKYGYQRPIRLGAAGGIGTPGAAASAFAMGAAFVLTGSVNQGAVQSGLAADGRALLAQAGLADVMMCAAADMFELGVKLQVLKRGTMFGSRANKLYDVYAAYRAWDDVPAKKREQIERSILRATFDEVWQQTAAFWQERNPDELARADRDPHRKMALCFRWYLGKSSRWAIAGQSDRLMDYQIWCGPAMGAFNDWVRGSFLHEPDARDAVQIARNLLQGATVVLRAQQLRAQGVPVPSAAFRFAPRPLH